MRVDENMTSPHISDIDKAAVDPAMCVVVLKFVVVVSAAAFFSNCTQSY